jgi:hypothetical protein
MKIILFLVVVALVLLWWRNKKRTNLLFGLGALTPYDPKDGDEVRLAIGYNIISPEGRSGIYIYKKDCCKLFLLRLKEEPDTILHVTTDAGDPKLSGGISHSYIMPGRNFVQFKTMNGVLMYDDLRKFIYFKQESGKIKELTSSTSPTLTDGVVYLVKA